MVGAFASANGVVLGQVATDAKSNEITAMPKLLAMLDLSVTVDVLDRVYATGRKAAADFKRTTRIAFDAYLPKWNYRAIPAAGT